jgi:hypothetical protein
MKDYKEILNEVNEEIASLVFYLWRRK